MKPTTITCASNLIVEDVLENPTLSRIKTLFGLAGTNFAAAWNGHEFELLEFGYWHESQPGDIRMRYDTPQESRMLVYYPIDSRMTEADIRGATVAYPNETNTCLLYTSPSPRDS